VERRNSVGGRANYFESGGVESGTGPFFRLDALAIALGAFLGFG
jgi:phytoene dehydrogenase-like protein